MRLPRVRSTVRRMMVAVAIVYLIAVGLRWGRGVYNRRDVGRLDT
jgi:hypothetical protein